MLEELNAQGKEVILKIAYSIYQFAQKRLQGTKLHHHFCYLCRTWGRLLDSSLGARC